MVTYADVIKAVNDKIETKYPDIKRTSSDDQDGITRPSFMVDLDDISEQSFMKVYRDREFTLSIKYFSTKASKNKIENLAVIETLSELFIDDDIINAGDFSIQIYGEVEIDMIDSVVHFNIPIFISDDINIIDDSEMMEELDLNLRKEG